MSDPPRLGFTETWFEADDDEVFDEIRPTWGRADLEIVLTGVRLEIVAIMTGIPLVDLSIDYEPHLIRGEN